MTRNPLQSPRSPVLSETEPGVTRAPHHPVQKRWRFRSLDHAIVEHLQKSCDIPLITSMLLQARNFSTAEAVRAHLACNLKDLREPHLLPGAQKAAELLHEAVVKQEKIIIYGDYDVDGMTAVAILFRCLVMLGANVRTFVPSRLEDGYGLNKEAINRLAKDGAQWIVTVDCGVSSVDEAEFAKSLGLRMIISDHHVPGPRLPAADAVVHPGLPGEAYPFDGLCGAGVALKIAWALCQVRSGDLKVLPQHRQFLLQAVGLAALGTIADIVPLCDENRLIAKHGLPQLHRNAPLGLAALLNVTRLAEKQSLGTDDVAFTIAPRLNAAGRLGQAQLGVELLTTENPERAMALAAYLHDLNSQRDSLERSVLLAATKQSKQWLAEQGCSALVLADRGWHQGVIGLVAGRLAERHHLPVVVISLDEVGIKPGVGSARSVPGFNLHEALAGCKSRLLSFGGHAAAAGVKIDEGELEAFRAEFCEQVGSHRAPTDDTPELWIDAVIPFVGLTLQAVEQMELLGPFGAGNPRPLLCVQGATIAGPTKRMGASGRHLSLMLNHAGTGLRGVAFGAGDREAEFTKPDATFDIVFRPIINDFRGRRSVEIQLVDWRASESPKTP